MKSKKTSKRSPTLLLAATLLLCLNTTGCVGSKGALERDKIFYVNSWHTGFAEAGDITEWPTNLYWVVNGTNERVQAFVYFSVQMYEQLKHTEIDFTDIAENKDVR